MAMLTRDSTEETWDVFLSHAGEQKKEMVDLMHAWLTNVYRQKCFLDEHSLKYGDYSWPRMETALKIALVGVVVISPEYVRKKAPMRELQILLENRRSQPNKPLFAIFHGYGVDLCGNLKAFRALYETDPWVGGEEKPEAGVLDAWAKSVTELCQYCGARQDQARHYQGQLAKVAVEGIIECLISIKKLPQGYSPEQLGPNFLSLKAPVLFGREKELAWLRERLCASQKFPAAVIRGGCGDGKTALARELGTRMYKAGDVPGGACPIDLKGASSDASIDALNFPSCVESLVLGQLYNFLLQSQAGLLDAKPGWENLEAWLRTSRGQVPMLLVFDNTEDVVINEDSAREFLDCWERLQAFPQLKMLAVSCMPVDVPYCDTLELDKLQSSSAADLLRHACGDATTDAETLERLADVCGHNAAAMTLVGRFINRRACTALEAIAAAERGGVMSIREDSKLHRIRDAREFETIRLWLAKCMMEDELCMLARLSVFPGSFNADGAAAVGRATSEQPPAPSHSWRRSSTYLIAAGASGILALLTFSIVPAVTTAALLVRMLLGGRCRRASQPAIKSARQQEGREVAAMLEDMRDCAVLEAALPACSAPCSQPASAELLAPRYRMHALIKEVAKDLLKLQGSGAQAVQLAFVEWMVTQAHQLRDLVPSSGRCNPASAAQLIANERLNFRQIQKVLASTPQACTSEAPQNSLLQVMRQLALDLRECGCLADAELIVRQNVVLHESVLGQEHWHTLLSTNNLAVVLIDLGKLEEAAGKLRQVLAQERVMEQGHPRTLKIKANLAATLLALGDLEEAAQLQRQVLNAQEQLLGQEHPDCLRTRGNLGTALEKLGKLDEAAQVQRQVLEAKERVLGNEHPDTLLTMGNFAESLKSLGKLEEAAQMQRQLLEVNKKVLGQEHPNSLLAMGNLAGTLRSMGKLEEAAQVQRQVLEVEERVLGNEHPSTLLTRGNLAAALQALGKLEEAAQMQMQVLRAQQRVLGQEHPHTLMAMGTLALVLQALGDVSKAAEMQRQVLEAKQRVLGNEHPSTLLTRGNLAFALQALGKLEEAAQMQRQVLKAQQQVLGQEHPDTLTTRGNLALALLNLGELEEAAQVQRQVLEVKERVLGNEHPSTLLTRGNLAFALQALGKLEEAAQMQRQVLRAQQRVLGQEHPDTLTTRGNLALALSRLGKLEEAAQVQRQLLEAQERVLGKEHLHTLLTRGNLAMTLQELGRSEEAAQMQRQVLEAQERVLGKEHPNTLLTRGNLAGTLQRLGKLEEAARMQRQVLEAQERVLGQEHPDALMSRGNLAVILYTLGNLEKAVQMERQVLEARERVLGQEHPATLLARGNLAVHLQAAGEWEEAARMQRHVLEARERLFGQEHPDTLTTRDNLAETLYALGDLEEAAKMQRQVLEGRERVLGREHPDTIGSRDSLAVTLQMLGLSEIAPGIDKEGDGGQ